MKRLLYCLFSLVLIWHSDRFYTQGETITYLNSISAKAKDIRIIADRDWFYIFWCEEKN